MKKLCVVLFAGLMLVGCGGKEKKVICTEKENDDEFVYEFNAKGDEILSHKIDVKIALADFELEEADLSDENIETTLSLIDALYISDYKNLEGVTITSKIDDAKEYYIAQVDINFEEASFNQLISAGLLDSGTQVVSLEMTLEDYTGCVEQ